MEERRIDTTVCLCGVREAIATILNRAFKFYTRGKVVIEYDDDVCAMNRKIQEANAHMSGFDAEFTLMDFLDDRGRMDSPFKDWVLSYLDEVPDGSEDYDVQIVGVTDCDGNFTLRIESHVKEHQRSYTDTDWHYWCTRMSDVHGVRITLERNI